MGRLEDMVCVVTGGAKGLGRVFVEALQRAGAKVAALDVAKADPVPGVLAITRAMSPNPQPAVPRPRRSRRRLDP